MLDAGHRQMICAALCINWQNIITNEEVCVISGLLLFSQAMQKRRLCLIGHYLHLQSRSITPFWSIYHTSRVNLSHLSGQSITPLGSIYHTSLVNATKPKRRILGMAWMWTLAKDLLNDLNAIYCNINDVINFSSSQFTRLADSFGSNFYCRRTFKYI